MYKNVQVQQSKKVQQQAYRSAIGIVLCNSEGKVFLARRNDLSDQWQFPQGGIEDCEEPLVAMYRELKEELDLSRSHVRVLGQTHKVLRYDFPESIRRTKQSLRCYLGQELTFFLLEFKGQESAINVTGVAQPEFDRWMWADYWTPISTVVEFKRDVYRLALNQLATYNKTED